MKNNLPRIAIIIPCFNEQAILPSTLEKLFSLLQEFIAAQEISNDSFLYCVDDGSSDLTWQIISEFHAQHSPIKGLRLSRNVGHQNALFAGLMSIKNKVDCAISIDADLQDDITTIKTMIEYFKLGNDIVYGVRKTREKDTFLKRITAVAFYKIMKRSGSNILINHADFRLLSARVLKQLSKFKERNLFLRGIVPLIGYKTIEVYYDRIERKQGKSKYTLRKVITLAWDGLTSFTHLPLDFILIFGILSFIMSVVLIGYALAAKFSEHTIPGWTSLMIPLCFMGGVQLLSIGILGQYIAKVYLEVKRRPRFIKDIELF